MGRPATPRVREPASTLRPPGLGKVRRPGRTAITQSLQEGPPKMISKAPSLFDRLQPRSMEVSNGDLIGVLHSLKLRGAHVSGMTSKPDNSGWRLIIEWPVMVARPMPGPVRSFPFASR